MNAYIKRLILVLALLFLPLSSALAVHVKGYTKKNGTYVAPHERSAPNHTKNDNYSTKGNVNPYTGKEGTKPRDQVTSTSTARTEPNASNSGAGSVPGGTRFDLLKPGMNKDQVKELLGEPNMKTATKWVYGEKTIEFTSGGVTK